MENKEKMRPRLDFDTYLNGFGHDKFCPAHGRSGGGDPDICICERWWKCPECGRVAWGSGCSECGFFLDWKGKSKEISKAVFEASDKEWKKFPFRRLSPYRKYKREWQAKTPDRRTNDRLDRKLSYMDFSILLTCIDQALRESNYEGKLNERKYDYRDEQTGFTLRRLYNLFSKKTRIGKIIREELLKTSLR